MGAQQAKSDAEELIVHGKQQSRPPQEQPKDVATHAADEVFNEIHKETVMSELSHTLMSQTNRIKVANFAKIKTEPRALDEYSKTELLFDNNRSKSINDATEHTEHESVHYIETGQEQLVSLETNKIVNEPPQEPINDISSSAQFEANSSSLVLNLYSSANNTKNVSNIQLKKEFLESQEFEINTTEVVPFNTTIPASEKDQRADNTGTIITTIKTESIEVPNIIDKVVEDEIIVGKSVENYKIKQEIIEIENSFNEVEDINTQKPQNQKLIGEIIEIDNRSDEEESPNRKFNEEIIELDNRSDEKKEVDGEQVSQNYQLVKNPLAFLKRRRNKKKSQKQHELVEKNNKDDDFLNKTVKSELINYNDELNEEGRHKSPIPKNTFDAKPLIDAQAVQSSINLKELIIKSEALSTADSNQEVYINKNLSKNCLSYNLNSSLDVNLSDLETHFDEALSTKSIEEVISNISINTSAESLKYSTIELSSVENDHPPVKNTSILKNSKTPLKQQKSKIRRSYKARQKRHIQNINQGKINKPIKKRGRKAKLKNINTEKDLSFASGFSKHRILKNLPKSCIKTRKKSNKSIVQKGIKKSTFAKGDFPKPFKSESPAKLQNEHNIATELPKPMMFKQESDINVKNKKQYLKPEYQPYVRLKRLKSEELLVPLKTKHLRKTRQFKSSSNVVKRLNYNQITNDNKHDFLIQHAFSLNQRIKLNRLSIDHDHSYHHNNNDQSSLYSRLTTPYSIPTDTPNDSLAETDSKYFSPQELYTLFHHSSTPESSSMFSGHIDSGVSTSTHDINRTLLLEIAAERAFINNHLLHFGYSPIQFNLYNDLNDLNVFLKYLLGNVNMN